MLKNKFNFCTCVFFSQTTSVYYFCSCISSMRTILYQDHVFYDYTRQCVLPFQIIENIFYNSALYVGLSIIRQNNLSFSNLYLLPKMSQGVRRFFCSIITKLHHWITKTEKTIQCFSIFLGKHKFKCTKLFYKY